MVVTGICGIKNRMEYIDSHIKWKNANQIADEMTDEEFDKKKLEEYHRRYKNNLVKKQGLDGFFHTWEKDFKYREIGFSIKVCRYYQLGRSEIQHKVLLNKLGKHVVLEDTKNSKPLRMFISERESKLEHYDFLWADTLHAGQENWTLTEMVVQMMRHATNDINWVLDKAHLKIDTKADILMLKKLIGTAKKEKYWTNIFKKLWGFWK